MRYLVFFCAAGALLAQTVPGRYIVELSTESVVEHVGKQSRRASLRSADAQSHRERVRAQQHDVRGRMPSSAVVLDSVDTVANAMFVQMSESEAKQVAGTAGVRRVLPVRTLHRLLDTAVTVAGVVDAWNQLPAGSAGAGVKIGIIDTGIDVGNPGFQDASMGVPDGFPKVNAESDRAFTNNKIIVARSYVSMLTRRDSDMSAQDHVGHGTALAMVAAGVRNAGPLATIAGVAPKAWLGSYKVFGTPGVNDNATDDAILKALEDAVGDGMDIVNLSLGYDLAPRLEDDPDVEAIERATRAGVLVVVAAGNNGSQPGTISSPATAPSAIAVGATHNARTFASTAVVAGVGQLIAVNASNSQSASTVTGTLFDAGLACDALPADSARGKVALILRGTCTFESKLNNAQQAGAVGALVCAAESAPEPIPMSAGGATLPAQMISFQDGTTAKGVIGSEVSLRFALSAVGINADRVASFSAAGPSVDASVKPDIVTVGADMYVATQRLDASGDMYSANGYILVDGTSFSSPMVAGAAALLKSARPGLTVDQYRSLLINAATPFGVTVQQAGSGRMNVGASLRSTATVYPAILNFGSGTGSPDTVRTLKITNTSASSETYSLLPEGSVAGPASATSTFTLQGGASFDVPVRWNATGLADGAYEGFVRVVASGGTEIRVPWWYGATSGQPSRIVVLDSISSGRRDSYQRDAVMFRVVDSAGLPIIDPPVEVTVLSGGGTAQPPSSRDTASPGLFSLQVRLGPAPAANVFRIQSGSAATDLTIRGN